MTCIVGLETENGVLIGADSASISGYNREVTTIEKVFIKEDRFLIGYTSSFRMGQLLQYKLEVPIQKEDQDDLQYLVSDFVESVRSCLKDGGYTKIESNREDGGFFLLGYRGKLYEFCSDFQINKSKNGFSAIGCGEDFAKAAMYTTQDHLPPKARIENALAVSEHFSCGVSSPFVVKALWNE